MDILKNQIYQVNIEGYNSESMGVCRVNGRAVFVPKTIVGESWEIKIVKVSASAVYAIPIKLLNVSPERQTPSCPHFGKCGGCDTWHMSYAEELSFKSSKVTSALRHIGKQELGVSEIIGSDLLQRYRNKGIFAIADVDGKPCFGFYRGRSHDLIPISDCLLQSELSCKTAKAVVDFMLEKRLAAYNEESGKGLVRHVFCRQSRCTSDAVACIVCSSGLGKNTEKFVKHLRSACPELSGIVLNVNKSRGNTVLAGDFYTLWGSANIVDELCGHKFEIAPQAFFQINPPQAEKLYYKALEYADLKGDELVFDLYCGAGTISLCLAEKAQKVIGAEIVQEAVDNAKSNAERNGIENVEFICADAGKAAKELAQRKLKPDVVVVDPPRKGMSEEAVEAVSSMNPARVVYVSCNPSTLARDILLFNSFGYVLSKATAVDMFTRTSHVESVALLIKSSEKGCPPDEA